MVEVKEEFRYRLIKAMDREGIRAADLARKTGLLESTISQYRSGYAKPKEERLALLANALHVNPVWLMGLDVLMDVQTNAPQPDYYIDPEAAEIAQRVFDDPDLRILFHAAQDVSPENIRLAAEMLRRMKETNPDG